MATSLLKLTMTASQPTTKANPIVKNFFNVAPVGGYTGAATYTIDDINWLDDAGVAVAAGGLTPIDANNGYALLFINGALQEGGTLTAVTANSITITFGAVTSIDAGKVITVSVANFAPSTTAPTITG